MHRIIGALLIAVLLVPAEVVAGDAYSLRNAMNREAVRVARTVVPTSTGQAPPRHRTWAARHPVVLGTAIGAGIGVALGAPDCSHSSDYTCSGIVAFTAGTGAGLGALGGLVASLFLR